MKEKTYAEAGVDIEAGDAFARYIAGQNSNAVSKAIGGFAGGLEIESGRWKKPVLYSTTDGVGTKIMIARKLGKFDTLGIDLVAMCVNDLVVTGATPLQFLDYIALGKIVPGFLEEIISGVIKGCEQAGCTLSGGETAEMPDVYGEDDFDLAGFAVGMAEAEEIRPYKGKIRSGDLLLGLPSTGIHSNGLSLARKVLPFESGFWPQLLTPTKIYVQELLPLFSEPAFLAAAHITGGGIEGNLVRVLPDGLRPRLSRAWKVPEVFHAMVNEGVEPDEMDKVFNMGIGMLLVVEKNGWESVTKNLTDRGIPHFEAGDLIA